MAGTFRDQVASFERKAKARALTVFHQSTADTAEIANTPEARGGKLPVVTSFLRNSQRGKVGGLPSGPSNSDESAPVEPVALSVLEANLGDTFYVGWTAAYARRLEYGFNGSDSTGRVYNQAGKGFLRAAVQLWPATVARAVAKAKRSIP